MIGGHDEIFKCDRPPIVMEFIVRMIRHLWKNAPVEDPDTDKEPCGLERELFIYKDLAAADSWKNNGAIPENADTMIHILRGSGTVTMVVDNPGSAEMKQLIEDIRWSLRRNWPMGMVKR